jgi:hypothetical protein
MIVYCRDYYRRGDVEPHKFDYLGHTFQPRRAKISRGRYFVGFLPAMSNKAAWESVGVQFACATRLITFMSSG